MWGGSLHALFAYSMLKQWISLKIKDDILVLTDVCGNNLVPGDALLINVAIMSERVGIVYM